MAITVCLTKREKKCIKSITCFALKYVSGDELELPRNWCKTLTIFRLYTIACVVHLSNVPTLQSSMNLGEKG